jgi:hypothetical protein
MDTKELLKDYFRDFFISEVVLIANKDNKKEFLNELFGNN